VSAREPGAWDQGMGGDREEARYEDLCEYARAVLDNPEHPHRDDFGGYARETISGLLKSIERLESRLDALHRSKYEYGRAENARLREALEEIATESRHDACCLEYGDDGTCAVEIARAAIAKVEGRP
jgi:hypothetical protein